MSFLPTRSFAPNDPYITLHDEDGQERDLGVRCTRPVSPLSPSPEFRQGNAEPPEPVTVSVNYPRDSALVLRINNRNNLRRNQTLISIKNFGKNICPAFLSGPNYSSIELGNLTSVSSAQDPFIDEPPPKYSPQKGWRKGMIGAAIVASFVLIFNVLFLAISLAKYGAPDGVGTLFTGSCAKAARMDSGMYQSPIEYLHIPIVFDDKICPMMKILYIVPHFFAIHGE